MNVSSSFAHLGKQLRNDSRSDRKRAWLVLFPVILSLVHAAAASKTVHCRNTYRDARAIQSALTAGGTVTLVGSCALGSTTLTLGSNVNIQGSGSKGNTSGHGATTITVINYTGSGYAFSSSGDNNTINGLTLNGGGIHLTKADTTNYTGQVGWTITNNTIENITTDTGGVIVDHVLGRGSPNNHSTISNNYFYNLWHPAYNASTSSPCPYGKGPTDCSPWAIYWGSGIDNTTIDGNFFYQIGGNPIKGFEDWFSGYTDPYTATNIVISNNDMQWYARIGIENQGQVNRCPGGCNLAANASNGTVISGNFIHNLASSGTGMSAHFAYSLFWADNAKIINNTAINEKAGPCNGSLSDAFEWAGFNGSVFQGNVVKSVNNTCIYGIGGGPPFPGWAESVTTGFTSIPNKAGKVACTYATCTVTYNNNIFVNPHNIPSDDRYGRNEGAPSATDWDQVTYITTGNYMTKNAGTVTANSSVTEAFAGRDNRLIPRGGNGTWNLYVISNLSVRNVSFYLDESSTPIVIQELQDVSNTFGTDEKWLYHATISTSSLNPGNHTITATATDVAGFRKSITQRFTVGK